MSADELSALIVVGTSHENGKSAKLAGAFAGALNARGVSPHCHALAKSPIRGCVNCGACTRSGSCVLRGDEWGELNEHLASADVTFIVAPVYFAGPTGALKSMLDRCQMFWSRKYLLKDGVPRKRPAYLAVVGDGGDPFGYDPLVTICTSALNCANVRIGPRVAPFVGDSFDLARVPALVDEALAEALRWRGLEDGDVQ